MTSNERHFLAYLDEMNIITILLPQSYHNGQASSFFLSSGLQNIPIEIKGKSRIESYIKYICSVSMDISFEKTNWIMDEHGGQTDLQIGAVIRTEAFDEEFYYCGDDLGVQCGEKKTQFKLWAPTATQVEIKLQSSTEPSPEIIKMARNEKGVWMVLVPRDLEYYSYTYLVCVNREWNEAVDPYATAVTPNGKSGVIVKMEKTYRPKPQLPPFQHSVDAIIYETHIRDFTIHPNSGVQNKGLYLGAAEKNTSGKDGQLTGLSYVADLGITHIEFLPFHDFAGVDEINQNDEYNWGYNPVHFNVPDGSYSTDPANPYARMVELKYLIEQIQLEGLRVVMDVVYNHVYIREQSSFEKIVPGYYFRHNEFGLPSNGTGVGNDLASERKMVRKYILDSIRFWITEYHIDGFRFDLMGILDVDTIREIKRMCDSLIEGILLLGEGWNLNTPLPPNEKASLVNQAKIPFVAQFNDVFRDSIKGSTFHLFDKGYAFGNEHYYDTALEVMAGSVGIFKQDSRLFNEPFQSVNYVECHDNHTMWDKLIACHHHASETQLMKYHLLATCIVLLSQGIPFLHSGQEFFRTKNGVGNSYCSPDSINQLDWDRKWKYAKNVEYVKGIIQIRKSNLCFRLRTTKEIKDHIYKISIPSPMLGLFLLNPTGNFHEMIVFINPTLKRQTRQIPKGKWFVLADEKTSTNNPTRLVCSTEIIIEPISLIIIGKT